MLWKYDKGNFLDPYYWISSPNSLTAITRWPKDIVMNGVITGTTTTVTHARPSIRKIRIKSIRIEHLYIERYWWVGIEGLMTELCAIIVGSQALPSLSAPSELFERYGLLCNKDDEGRPLLTWAAPRSYGVDVLERPNDGERYGIYVPLGFSTAILDLAMQGIVRVTSLKTCTSVIRLGETPLPVYTLIAHDYKQREFFLLREGQHGIYKIVASAYTP